MSELIGLDMFCLLIQFYEIELNKKHIIKEYQIKQNLIDLENLKDICREIGIKNKEKLINKKKIKKLKKLEKPFLCFKKGEWVIVQILNEDEILIINKKNELTKSNFENYFIDDINEVILFKKKNSIDRNEGIKFILKDLKKYKWIFIQILFAYFILQLISLMNPLFIQVIIDKVLGTKNIDTLYVLSFILIIAYVFELAISISKDYLLSHTTNKIDMSINNKFMKHLLRLPIAYFEARKTGDIIAKVRETENVRKFITGSPLTSILDLAFVVIYIVILFMYNSKLTFITLSIIPLTGLIYFFVTPIFRERVDDNYNKGAKVQSFLVEMLNGINTVKSFSLEKRVESQWAELEAKFVQSKFCTNKLVFTINSIMSFIQKIQDVVIIALGSVIVMYGNMTIGELIAYRMIAGRLTNPILKFIQMWQDYQQVKLSVKRIDDVLKNKIETTGDVCSLLAPSIKGSIVFKEISFRYNLGENFVLKNMNFIIPRGAIVGIIGRSGSGKSTISKLIQKLYIPESGSIYIDDINICQVDPKWIRSQIGVVLQENCLFSGSIFDNIKINAQLATMEEVIAVSKIAGAHEFITELPDGYNTILGEMGSGLSGGQKQRIAIARSLITNPKILIFDEATSALDYESEAIIQKNLNLICKGRTVIIIAHRLSTLNSADYIMTVDNGKVIEYGSKEDMIRDKKSFYSYLMKQQKGD